MWNIAKKNTWRQEGRFAKKSEIESEYTGPRTNFLSSWLREDTEGKAEEMEEMRKRNKEEEVKSGKRKV